MQLSDLINNHPDTIELNAMVHFKNGTTEEKTVIVDLSGAGVYIVPYGVAVY